MSRGATLDRYAAEGCKEARMSAAGEREAAR
jgi:hypothetical protein